MATFEEKIDSAVRDGIMPGVILYAKDKSGKLDYVKIAGTTDITPGKGKPLQPDTILLLASGTKLLTTIAVLQLVERGLVQLDDDVTRHLPTLASQPILTKFASDGKPEFTQRTKPITLRHLLTHSSGLAYDFLTPSLQQYEKHVGMDPRTTGTVDGRMSLPLLFEPGTAWAYGTGLDFAGQIVEKLSGMTLDEYMARHMWPQLGIKNITFWPHKSPELAAKRWAMSTRDESSGKVVPMGASEVLMNAGSTECFGGHGGYASMEDYVKVLYSLLIDDEKLLKKETAALMFQPQLEKGAKASLLEQWKSPDWAVGVWPPTGEYDHGLSGILVDGDKHEYRRRGTLLWSGAVNMPWFIDREAGICGVFGTQVFPPAELVSKSYIEAFEREMYRRLAHGPKI